MKALILACAIAVALGGCGGGDTPTASTGTATTPASSVMSPAEIEFRQYLSRSAAALKPYRAAQKISDAAEDLVTAARAPTRAERSIAAKRFVMAAQRYELSAVKQLRAKPPAQLRAINRRFAALSTRVGSRERYLARAVENANWPVSWNRLVNERIADDDVRPEWRDAVVAYAGDLGIETPGWVKIIGTPRP